MYGLVIALAANMGHSKARAWVKGRRDWESGLRSTIGGKPCIWMHVSSVGELEQGRPVAERIKQIYPELPLVISFFSPSGYEQRKDEPLADHTCYLPLDTPDNAEKFS